MLLRSEGIEGTFSTGAAVIEDVHVDLVVRQTQTALIVWGLPAIFSEGGEQFRPKKLWRKLQAAMHKALFDLGRRYQQNLDPPA